MLPNVRKLYCLFDYHIWLHSFTYLFFFFFFFFISKEICLPSTFTFLFPSSFRYKNPDTQAILRTLKSMLNNYSNLKTLVDFLAQAPYLEWLPSSTKSPNQHPYKLRKMLELPNKQRFELEIKQNSPCSVIVKVNPLDHLKVGQKS